MEGIVNLYLFLDVTVKREAGVGVLRGRGLEVFRMRLSSSALFSVCTHARTHSLTHLLSPLFPAVVPSLLLLYTAQPSSSPVAYTGTSWVSTGSVQ